MFNLSWFTHFSWGKIWFERFALCKRYDISQLCSSSSSCYLFQVPNWIFRQKSQLSLSLCSTNGICFIFDTLQRKTSIDKIAHTTINLMKLKFDLAESKRAIIATKIHLLVIWILIAISISVENFKIFVRLHGWNNCAPVIAINEAGDSESKIAVIMLTKIYLLDI